MIPLSEKEPCSILEKGQAPSRPLRIKKNGAYFLITPPVSALLTASMSECRAVLHPEFGMEALPMRLRQKIFRAIVAVADGESVFSNWGTYGVFK